MSTRERQSEQRIVPRDTGEGDEPEGVTQAREGGDAFLRAADRAIERALSGTPEEFLRQNRQLGGQ